MHAWQELAGDIRILLLYYTIIIQNVRSSLLSLLDQFALMIQGTYLLSEE